MTRPRNSLPLAIVACAIACAFGAALPARGRSQEPDARAVLADVRTRYAAMRTLRARFEQRFHHRLHDRETRWTGRIALARPGRLRIDYDEPWGRLVVSDGRTLFSYEPEPEPGQYYEQAVSEDAMPLAFALLLGEGPPDEALVARLVDARATGFAGAVVELRPTEPVPQLERVWLYVDRRERERGRVHRLLVIDPAGNTHRFELTAQRENASIPASTFTFRPPPGAHRVPP